MPTNILIRIVLVMDKTYTKNILCHNFYLILFLIGIFSLTLGEMRRFQYKYFVALSSQ